MVWKTISLASCTVTVLFCLAFSCATDAAINVSSDGSDGTFNPTVNVEVDLSQAVTGIWDQNNTANAGKGIYDPAKWAVVFKYSSINIPTGVTVTFKNHPSGAPVVWLVQGDAAIAGTVNLNGKTSEWNGLPVEGGPGGFGGGAGVTSVHSLGSGGGPGGAQQPASGYFFCIAGSYATAGAANAYSNTAGPTYGNPYIVPLLGGSGGTGRGDNPYSGGGGGGALLMAVAGTASVTGSITANGGSGNTNGGGAGSGGGIRIMADTFTGNGTLNAVGASTGVPGGSGRIRIESNVLTFTGSVSPGPSYLNPFLSPPAVWPPTQTPTVTIASLGTTNSPEDPYTGLTSPDHYVSLDVAPSAPFTVRINAANVPLTWKVLLRVVPVFGKDVTVAATNVSGDATASVWEAPVTVGTGVYSMQVRASKP